MNALIRSTSAFLQSSIGRKIIVAVTGLALAAFLAGHLAGNMLIYIGPDAFNAYAKKLHDMPALVWAARLGLLGAVALHIYFTIQLTRENKSARPKYAYEGTIQASKSSRMMIWSGLTIAAFVVYHLMHYTIRIGNEYNNMEIYSTIIDGEVAHNAYLMVIHGFSVWWVSAFYLLAMALLCSHLGHGIASVFQTIGFSSAKTRPLFNVISHAYAWVIFVGFASIPVAVLVFGMGRA